MSSSPRPSDAAAKVEWKVTLSEPDIGESEIAAVVAVLRSRWLTMGAVTAEFERRFAEATGVRHAFAMTNCTAGLHLANVALGVSPGDEVICPALTFVATANAAVYAGATPVFADVVSDSDLTIDPADIERKITAKTKAISVVHYGGYACRMDEIMDIAIKHGLAVIEDCAHSPLMSFISADGDRKLGSIGGAGCFSFFGNKNMTTAEGGMTTTNDDAVAEKIRLLRSHGMTSLTLDRHKGHSFSYDVIEAGFNYRMDEIRSAVGLAQLDRLPANNAKRLELVKRYAAELAQFDFIMLPFGDRLSGREGLHIMPVLLAPGIDRMEFMKSLRDSGVQTSIHYPPVHLFTHYRKQYGCAEGMLPVTEDVCAREVTLPLHALMSMEDVELVVDGIKSFKA